MGAWDPLWRLDFRGNFDSQAYNVFLRRNTFTLTRLILDLHEVLVRTAMRPTADLEAIKPGG